MLTSAENFNHMTWNSSELLMIPLNFSYFQFSAVCVAEYRTALKCVLKCVPVKNFSFH